MKFKTISTLVFLLFLIAGAYSQSFVNTNWEKPSYENGTVTNSIAENSNNERTVNESEDDFTPSFDFQYSGSNVNVINFTLTRPGFVNIRIYDSNGKTIDELAKSSFAAGDHFITWNRSKVSQGTFYYSLITEEYSTTKKLQ